MASELDYRFLPRRPPTNAILAVDFNRGAIDLADSPLTLSPVSSPTTTGGVFNANGGYYTVANNAKLQPTSTLSMALTYYANAQWASGGYYHLLERQQNYSMYIYNRSGNFEVMVSAWNLSYTASIYWYQSGWGNTGTKWHVSASFDSSRTNGGEFRLFRNGVYLAPSSIPNNSFTSGNFYTNSNILYVGRGINGTVGNINIDNLIMSKDAWTDAQHLEIYNSWKNG